MILIITIICNIGRGEEKVGYGSFSDGGGEITEIK